MSSVDQETRRRVHTASHGPTTATAPDETTSPEWSETRGESVANVVSHALGGVAMIAATPLLVFSLAGRGGVWGAVGASIFAATAILTYSASTFYHAARQPAVKRVFLVLDHCAIYLLIAGTYTPFMIGVIRGGWGWSLFGVVWGLASLGVAMEVFSLRRTWLALSLYLAMGWLALAAIVPIVTHIPPTGVLLLLIGGLAYTAGTYFYVHEKPYYHFVWHLFVLAGTTTHTVAVWSYAV